MAQERICAIDGCCKPVIARGWCSKHYQRWQKTGSATARVQEKGAAEAWLLTVAVSHKDSDCLIFPFPRRRDGYGQFEKGGQKVLAHRFVCEVVNGEAPKDRPDAAHSCGRGADGCVNPMHLRWDSKSGNMADKLHHGTHNRGRRNPISKLTEECVAEIRRLAGTAPYREIGRRFGVSHTTARKIALRERWGWLP